MQTPRSPHIPEPRYITCTYKCHYIVRGMISLPEWEHTITAAVYTPYPPLLPRLRLFRWNILLKLLCINIINNIIIQLNPRGGIFIGFDQWAVNRYHNIISRIPPPRVLFHIRRSYPRETDRRVYNFYSILIDFTYNIFYSDILARCMSNITIEHHTLPGYCALSVTTVWFCNIYLGIILFFTIHFLFGSACVVRIETYVYTRVI